MLYKENNIISLIQTEGCRGLFALTLVEIFIAFIYKLHMGLHK